MDTNPDPVSSDAALYQRSSGAGCPALTHSNVAGLGSRHGQKVARFQQVSEFI